MTASTTPSERGAAALLEAAQHVLVFILDIFWSPAELAARPGVWQWTKFDFLDWLRPLELLLRRFLLIEAFTLALSQSLPLSRSRPSRPRKYRQIEIWPDRPEDWHVRFPVLMPAPRPCRRHRKRLPAPYPHVRGEPDVPARFRRVVHSQWPLARRLQAVIQIIENPAARIRSLAFSLRRTTRKRVVRTLLPPSWRCRLLTDALAQSGERGAELANAFWSSA